MLVMLIAAAAAAKSRQSCPTLCDPMDSSPPDSTVPGIFQARELEWRAIAFSELRLSLDTKMRPLGPIKGVICVSPTFESPFSLNSILSNFCFSHNMPLIQNKYSVKLLSKISSKFCVLLL